MNETTMPALRTLHTLDSLSAYDAYRWAEELFAERDYYTAVKVLRHLVDTHPEDRDLGAARELLARAYFHSSQNAKAVEAAREVLERDPANEYAALLLARSLERVRDPEAAAAKRLAAAMGR